MSEIAARLPSVLFVDDDEQLLRGIRRLMRRHLDLTTASSAQEALDLLEGGARFDVLVTDMRMPGMSGAELCRRASEIDDRMARVVLSGYQEEGQAEEASAVGVFATLEKPCDRSVLLEVVHAAVARQRRETPR